MITCDFRPHPNLNAAATLRERPGAQLFFADQSRMD